MQAALRSLRAAQPPRSRKQPFPRSFARVRAREALGVREKGGEGEEEEGSDDGGGGEVRDADEVMRTRSPGSRCSHRVEHHSVGRARTYSGRRARGERVKYQNVRQTRSVEQGDRFKADCFISEQPQL